MNLQHLTKNGMHQSNVKHVRPKLVLREFTDSSLHLMFFSLRANNSARHARATGSLYSHCTCGLRGSTLISISYTEKISPSNPENDFALGYSKFGRMSLLLCSGVKLGSPLPSDIESVSEMLGDHHKRRPCFVADPAHEILHRLDRSR